MVDHVCIVYSYPNYLPDCRDMVDPRVFCQFDHQLANASSFEVDFNQVLIPTKTELTKNYPNPFNPVTNIDYSIAIDSYVSLIVYNLNGAEVKTLINQNMISGVHQIQWDGTNNSGENVASGRYIVKMNAKDYSSQIKMTLLK